VGNIFGGTVRNVPVRQRTGTAVTQPFEAHKPLLSPNLRRFLLPVRTKFSISCEDRTRCLNNTVELSRTELWMLPPLVLGGVIENQNSDFVTVYM
jgi:hypothetical protein